VHVSPTLDIALAVVVTLGSFGLAVSLIATSRDGRRRGEFAAFQRRILLALETTCSGEPLSQATQATG